MKCPVCGHKSAPAKNIPANISVIPAVKISGIRCDSDDTDTRSTRSSAHKHGSVSGKKAPGCQPAGFLTIP